MIQTILSNLFSTMMASKLCTNARNNNVSLHLTTPKNTLRFLGKKSSSPQAKNATLFKQLQVNSLNTTNKTCTKKTPYTCGIHSKTVQTTLHHHKMANAILWPIHHNELIAITTGNITNGKYNSFLNNIISCRQQF